MFFFSLRKPTCNDNNSAYSLYAIYCCTTDISNVDYILTRNDMIQHYDTPMKIGDCIHDFYFTSPNITDFDAVYVGVG